MKTKLVIIEEAEAARALEKAKALYAKTTLELRIYIGAAIQKRRESLGLSRDRAAALLGLGAGRSTMFLAESPLVAKKSLSVEKLSSIYEALEKLAPLIPQLPPCVRGRHKPLTSHEI